MPKPNPYRQVDRHAPDLTGPVRALPWADSANCATTDPDLFFELSTTRYAHVSSKEAAERESAAKAVCRRCPVRAECRAYALAHPELDGIWGAMTRRERERARKEAS